MNGIVHWYSRTGTSGYIVARRHYKPSEHSGASRSIPAHPVPRYESWIDKWKNRLQSLSKYERNWNSYDAPAPSEEAIEDAITFLDARFTTNPNLEPGHIGASVAGGVGITFFCDPAEVAIEFSNSGYVVVTEIQESGDQVVTDTQVLNPWVEGSELSEIVEDIVCGRNTRGNVKEEHPYRSQLQSLRDALSPR